MNLHHDTQLFSQTLRAASQSLEINIGFVEKDQDPSYLFHLRSDISTICIFWRRMMIVFSL